MNTDISNYIKSFAIEALQHTNAGANMEKAIHFFQNIQTYAFSLEDKKNELGMTGIKVISLTVFSILRKIASGKSPADFDQNDWKEIASFAAESAILENDTSYSVFVFSMYERYIRDSLARIQAIILPEAAEKITLLADELHFKTEALRYSHEAEAAITEDCLWICLEAMIKLLASTASLTGSQHASELSQAVAAYCFEYGRLRLYKQEEEIISALLESQHVLDAELETKQQQYLDALMQESKQFYNLVSNAFAPDFHTAFLQSVLLAKNTGTAETEILHTLEDVDSFFLD